VIGGTLTRFKMQFEHNSLPVPVSIIGRSHASEFRGLISQIQNSSDLQITGQFETIQDALTAGLGEQFPADVVIVLLEFSDEYSAADAGQLIGRMLFRRVLCCYGPWCLSDGRTHEIWPVVARVSVSSAWSILQHEIRNIRAGVDALLPMAAAEEVFAHRAIAEFDDYPTGYEVVLIASDDRALRKTIAKMLRHTAKQVFESGIFVTQIQNALARLNAAAAVQSKVSVLLDIDGLESRESELRTVIRSTYPASRLVRLTSFPHTVPENGSFDQIVDKLEVNSQLIAGLFS
jgi:hypothetical protein